MKLNRKDSYDSKEDTMKHIEKVGLFMQQIIKSLIFRSEYHDDSKLGPEEKPTFDEMTPKLRGTTYGSKEYRKFTSQMKVAMKHHYEHNRHHPEHFENGIDDMTLVDIIEMLCDWKAATLRHEDGDIIKSMEINSNRFNISPQLKRIIENTIKDFHWSKDFHFNHREVSK